MAMIQTSYTVNSKNCNISQEPQEQKKETFGFSPIIYVKDIYESFDYEDYNNNNCSSSTANSNDAGKQQQQQQQQPFLKSYGTAHQVLNGIELRIIEREFVAIVGPSGCGKSTLLNILAGLDRPDSGSVLIRGDLASNNSSSTKIIMVFQEGALFPWLNLPDNVEFGLKAAKVPKDLRHQIADRYIEMVGLTKFSESFVYQLLGGMKQRVTIACALVMEPDILLTDEPFASLDIQTRHLLYDELIGIHKTTGKTVLFVTHNINEAILLGDRVIILLSSALKNIKENFELTSQGQGTLKAESCVKSKNKSLESLKAT